ncbi:MAG: hypothetical protein ACRDO1_06070 [Nocardioidaceae bacterium]
MNPKYVHLGVPVGQVGGELGVHTATSVRSTDVVGAPDPSTGYTYLAGRGDHFDYTYLAGGRGTPTRQSETNRTNWTSTYTYDPIVRLTRAWELTPRGTTTRDYTSSSHAASLTLTSDPTW